MSNTPSARIPVQAKARDRIYVLWDYADFPVEGDDDIEEFYRNVKSSLQKEGYYGDIQMFAFGRKERTTQEAWQSIHSRIILTLHKSRFARHHNLLMDWVKSATQAQHACDANYMLIMKGMPEEQDIEFATIIKEVTKRDPHSALFFVVGDEPQDMSEYPSDVLSCFTNIWSGLKSGGAPIAPVDPDVHVNEPAPKRHRLDDDDEGGSNY